MYFRVYVLLCRISLTTVAFSTKEGCTEARLSLCRSALLAVAQVLIVRARRETWYPGPILRKFDGRYLYVFTSGFLALQLMLRKNRLS